MSFTQPINIAGISATTQLVYTTNNVAAQYTKAIEDLNQQLMIVFSTKSAPQSALDAMGADVTLLKKLFTSGVTDPKNGTTTYMTLEMAKNLQPLFNLLSSSAIGVDVSASPIKVTQGNINNWAAQIQLGYDDPSALFNTLALQKALAAAQNVNIQSLIELQYVENGNSVLGAQLSGLQAALGVTQSALNQLAELQRLHNQLAINSPQPFSVFFDIKGNAAGGYAGAYQKAASAYFSQVNPTLSPSLYSSGYEDAQIPAGAYGINPNFKTSVVDVINAAKSANPNFALSQYTTDSSSIFNVDGNLYRTARAGINNVYLFPEGTVLSDAFISYMGAQRITISKTTFEGYGSSNSLTRYAFIGEAPPADTYANLGLFALVNDISPFQFAAPVVINVIKEYAFHSSLRDQTSYKQVIPLLAAIRNFADNLINMQSNLSTDPQAVADNAQQLIANYSIISNFDYAGVITQAIKDDKDLSYSYKDIVEGLTDLQQAFNTTPNFAKDINNFQIAFSNANNNYPAYQAAKTIGGVIDNLSTLVNPPLGFSVKVSSDYNAILLSNTAALKVVQAVGLQNFTVLTAGKDIGLRFNSTTNSFQTSYDIGNMRKAYQELIAVKSSIASAINYLKKTTKMLPNGELDPTSLAGTLQVVLNDLNKTVAANGVPTSALTPMSVAFAGFRNWLIDNYDQTNTTQNGVIQQDITYAITAAQGVNSTQQENVRNYLYVFEEYYKSASDILTAISQIINKMAQSISR